MLPRSCDSVAVEVVRGAKQTHKKGPEKLEKIGRFLENSSFSGKFQFFGTASISVPACQEILIIASKVSAELKVLRYLCTELYLFVLQAVPHQQYIISRQFSFNCGLNGLFQCNEDSISKD